MKIELWNEKEDHLPKLHFRSSMLVFGMFLGVYKMFISPRLVTSCLTRIFFQAVDCLSFRFPIEQLWFWFYAFFCRCENLLIQAICWYNMNFICILYIYIHICLNMHMLLLQVSFILPMGVIKHTTKPTLLIRTVLGSFPDNLVGLHCHPFTLSFGILVDKSVRAMGM